jgi:hypothetical protein
MPEDPFFQPTTEAERAVMGDTVHEGQVSQTAAGRRCGQSSPAATPLRCVCACAQGVNTARGYVDGVRRRKGLPTAKRIVAHAEKQRTRARKK